MIWVLETQGEFVGQEWRAGGGLNMRAGASTAWVCGCDASVAPGSVKALKTSSRARWPLFVAIGIRSPGLLVLARPPFRRVSLASSLPLPSTHLLASHSHIKSSQRPHPDSAKPCGTQQNRWQNLVRSASASVSSPIYLNASHILKCPRPIFFVFLSRSVLRRCPHHQHTRRVIRVQ